MKKIVFLIVSLIAINLCVCGQNFNDFNDGGFEDCWVRKTPSSVSGKPAYDDFKDDYLFSTLNTLYDLPLMLGNLDEVTAIKLSGAEPYGGSFALKLVAKTMTAGFSPTGYVFLPGAMGTINIDIGTQSCTLGRDFTRRPDSIRGYFKYLPVNGDSAAIEIWLENTNGTVLGRGKEIMKNTVSEWSSFNVPINYTSGETPAKIVILFAASAKYDFTDIYTLMECKGQNGSTLCLDDIALVYGGLGVKEMLTPGVTLGVYPNPSTDMVKLKVGKVTKGNVIIYDYQIRKMGEYPVDGTEIEIDVKDYAAGAYLINVVEDGKVITTNKFVKQ